MGQDNTVDVINSIAKPRFAGSVINLVPNQLYLIKQVKFDTQNKLGRYFEQPVVLADEQGFTYADEDDGLYTLNDSISMVVKSAEVVSQQLTGRSAISYKEAAVAQSAGEQAFVNSTMFRYKNLADSAAKRLEIAMIYGRSATGLARCVTGTTASSTQFRFDVPASQWASGIWSCSMNAQLDSFNDTGTAVSTAAISVYNVDFDNKYVYVTGASADITAINAAIGTGIVLRFHSANNKEMYGLDRIILNTGTLFEIDAASYQLWKGNTYSAGTAALTINKLLKALNQPLGKGLESDVTVLVAFETFASLNADEAALRIYDSSYKVSLAERGNEKICYHYQHGKIEIVSHPMVKAGEAFVLPLETIKRVGSTDLSFTLPGQEDKMFSPLENKNGFQFRIYSDQAIFLERPGVAVKITDIVNS